ncbi:MAG: prepilin-type N-terminal cleavage/methylation domain-containing protein [Candidatus Gracilibacteria bacterium]|nr:prepilin-type N-terminal cleavage/methylation domain-containing protein [Candidatus Gracilibacteria bacterium]
MKKGNIFGNKGFTLIEMLVSVTIFAMVMVIAVEAIGNIGILRNKISDRTDINKDLYYSIENLVSLVKEFGGQIDYDEYFNRSSIGTSTQSGHYLNPTGYGNYGSGGNIATNVYGDGFYYCRSSGTSMGTGGCLDSTFNTYGNSASGKYQRYGEYTFQFIDYNSNKSNDLYLGNPNFGDEDSNGNIRSDDDDENLGIGPVVFTSNEVKELYLLSKGKTNERLFLRMRYKLDPNAPPAATCDENADGSMSGDACLGNIEMLRLDGRDLGFDHVASTTDSGEYDGIIDTWQCNADFKCNGTNDLPKGENDEWVPLFPEYINVRNVRFFVYPTKDYKLSWRDKDINTNVNPYVRLNITLGFAWVKRIQFNNSNPSVNISTTINLNKTK